MSDKPETTIDPGLEADLLTLMCWNGEHAEAVMRVMPHELFSTPTFRMVAKAAQDYISRYAKAPGVHLEQLLPAARRRGAEGEMLQEALVGMRDQHALLNIQYLLDSLDDFAGLRMVEEAAKKALDHAINGKLTEAREALSVPVAASHASDPEISFNDLRFDKFLRDTDDVIDIGIPPLKDLGIGLQRGTMTMLIAAAKRGKSWFLIHVGRTALRKGHSVLHISLENSAKMTAKRYMQCMTGMVTTAPDKGEAAEPIIVTRLQRDDNYRAIGVYVQDAKSQRRLVLGESTFPSAESAYHKIKGSDNNNLVVKHFPHGSLTTQGLASYINTLKQTRGFVPDVLIVDYPDLMKHAEKESARMGLGNTFASLRGLAVTHNLALATVTQGNRQSSQAKRVTPDMVAEDWSKIGTADLVFAYSQTEEEAVYGLARLGVVASRNTEDGFEVLMTQDYRTGQFCKDGARLNATLNTALKEFTGQDSTKGKE